MIIRGQRIGRVGNTRRVKIREARLTTVRAGQPPEKVIKRTILHHHDHDVLDVGEFALRLFGVLARGQQRGA